MSHLNIAEAVPLGYAMVARVAEDAGVRVLAIKGPVNDYYGLDLGRIGSSVDVDVLVDPSRAQPFIQALRGAGWYGGESPLTGQILPLHSVNLRHENWPCEVDLHFWWPGFLADPQHSFEVLWRDSIVISWAGLSYRAPNDVGSLSIAYLHKARDGSRACAQLLECARARFSNPTQRENLARLVAEVGGARTLKRLCEAMNVVPVSDGQEQVPFALWLARQQHAGTPLVPAVFDLARTSGALPKLRRAKQLLLLSREEIPLHPEASSAALLIFRMKRLFAALKFAASHRKTIVCAARDALKVAGRR